jgi:hypothetical protein
MLKSGSLICVALFCPAILGQSPEEAKKINEAIDKGVAYVKSIESGAFKRPGGCSLRGWVLLETGVPATDELIKNIAGYIRLQGPEMNQVYDLALSMIFLDKLNDPGDDPLIQSLAVRLLGAQSETDGDWTYHTGVLKAEERLRLAEVLKQADEIRKKGLKFPTQTPEQIQREMERQYRALEARPTVFKGDNSNTQFAIIAMWVARRHGVKVDQCLILADKGFRASQVKTGEWGYDYPDKGEPVDTNHYSYPAMTCSGLLGLALGQGVVPNPKDLHKDPQVQLGLKVLANALTADPPAPGKKDNACYFLFSMERVAVIYNLPKIGDHDWYAWGLRKLLASQASDGSWSAGFHTDAADTCFALLFLKRANVAKDLTQLLLDAPLRKGPGNKNVDTKKKPANDLFDPPKVAPKKDAPKDKAPKQSRLHVRPEEAVGSVGSLSAGARCATASVLRSSATRERLQHCFGVPKQWHTAAIVARILSGWMSREYHLS